jgi:DNA-binding transcriptional ArsR family regulator
MDDRQDQVFKALADASRRQILSALCGEPMVAGELGRLVSLAPNAVSFHLKLLQEAGLVSVRRQGRYIWYQVEQKTIEEWQAHTHGLFSNLGNAQAFDPHSSRPPLYEPAGCRTPAHDRPAPGADAPVGPSGIHTPPRDQTTPTAEPSSNSPDSPEAAATALPEDEDRLPSELL